MSFGPEHAPLERKHVDQALDEAEHLRPKPDLVLFAAFHFDPEDAKDIDECFWLIGQPDIEVENLGERGASAPCTAGTTNTYRVTV